MECHSIPEVIWPLKVLAYLEVMADSVAYEASATYEQVRPSYSVESVKFFSKKLGILEQQRTQPLSIRAGTGKFTRVLMLVLRYPRAVNS